MRCRVHFRHQVREPSSHRWARWSLRARPFEAQSVGKMRIENDACNLASGSNRGWRVSRGEVPNAGGSRLGPTEDDQSLAAGIHDANHPYGVEPESQMCLRSGGFPVRPSPPTHHTSATRRRSSGTVRVGVCCRGTHLQARLGSARICWMSMPDDDWQCIHKQARHRARRSHCREDTLRGAQSTRRLLPEHSPSNVGGPCGPRACRACERHTMH